MSDDLTPWKILNIPPTATVDDIRRAWRDGVRTHHPDRGGDPEKFRQIHDAFRTLMGRSGSDTRSNDASGNRDVVLDGEMARPVMVEVLVSHRDAVLGGRVAVARWRLNHCDDCGGRGDGCGTCRGDGRVGGYHSFYADIGPRVRHGDVVRFEGLGDAGPRRRQDTGRAESNAGPFGPLDIRVLVEHDDAISEVGDDLVVTVPVSFFDAALGGTVSVAGLDGTYPVAVPAGTQAGERLRVVGRGQLREDGSRGDLVGVVHITINRLSSEQEHLLAQVRDHPSAYRRT